MPSALSPNFRIGWLNQRDLYLPGTFQTFTFMLMCTKARIAESKLIVYVVTLSMQLIRSRSPGYALTLLAESTTSAIHCAEALSHPSSARLVTPEDVALAAARSLLVEI